MRSFVAAAMSRGFRAVVVAVALLGGSALIGQGVGMAGAATTDVRADAVTRSSISVGLTGAVGLVAVLVGAAGLTVGLARLRRRQSVARKAAEHSADATLVTQPQSAG